MSLLERRFSQVCEVRVSRTDSRRRLRLSFEQVEPRHCLAAIGFAGHVLDGDPLSGSFEMATSDLDGDGDLDFISAVSGISWSQNLDSRGTFGARRIVSTEATRVDAIIAGDLDGDGDNDVISTEWDGELAWNENRDGRGTFGPKRLISNDTWSTRSLAAADINGDGRLDLVRAVWDGSKESLFWYENRGGGKFRARLITDQVSPNATPVDLDRDGDLDVVTGTAWFENTNGAGVFVERDPIFTSYYAFVVQDVDQNGRLDIIVNGTWYQASIEPTEFVVQQRDLGSFVDTFAGDFNGDGNTDLMMVGGPFEFSCSYYELSNAGRYVYVGSGDNGVGSGSAVLSDLDGDLRDEVLFYDGQGLTYWRRLVGGPRQVIDQSSGYSGVLTTGDLDGDGRKDLIAALYDGGCNASPGLTCTQSLLWRKNLGTPDNVSAPMTIVTEFAHWRGGYRNIWPNDVDQDGDIDLITRDESSVSWYENQGDGTSFLSAKRILEAYSSDAVVVDDIDNDGQLDILRTWRTGESIQWSRFEVASGSFETRSIAADWLSMYISQLLAGDMDGDGDLDLVVSGRPDSGEHVILWFEYLVEQQTFGSARDVLRQAENAPTLETLADLDGDGDTDVVLTTKPEPNQEQLSWIENFGQGEFGSRRAIATSRIFGNVTFADLDRDGDDDLLTFHWDSSGTSTALYERADDEVAFLDPIAAFPAAQFVLDDLDLDGDLDALTGYGEMSWEENRPVGDANGDGQFNSSDFVYVFLAGKYEDDVPNNATFADGDWDGDGDFTSRDIVAAFQAGTYVATAIGASGTVTSLIDVELAISMNSRSSARTKTT